MTNRNSYIAGLFPNADEFQQFLNRDAAISLLCRTLEASRASVDEITTGAARVLTVEEQFTLDIIAERLALAATEISGWTSNAD